MSRKLEQPGRYKAGRVDCIAAEAEDLSLLGGSVGLGRLEGRVGGHWHGWQGRRARLAGSAGLVGGGTAGRVGKHGGPGVRHGWPGGAWRAGRIGQGQAGWCGRSGSGECTYVWFLEMCVPSELTSGIKLAIILDTWLQC